ncbi:TIGR00725 family protein [Acuticoccus kandeliae]|uniref:TIGR00725 family protein n=1 Tax=Acuticoccus kandeliae TaxID=2073160 RepID=UPI000D3EBAF9|nr:TIGR00725 family protein [Acuticoccus kandeliae]
MLPDLRLAADGTVWRDTSRFDPWRREWVTDGPAPADARPVDPGAALKAVNAGRARRLPVAVIGPRVPEAGQADIARALGEALGQYGVQMICGGKGGVMEAACEGHLAAGGLPIGILPDDEWTAANPYVAIPIATGLGPARNAIIARAATVLIAVGGGYGTLSEIAYGLHFDRLVLTLAGAPEVNGAIVCATVEEAMGHVARHLLNLPLA